MQMRAATVVQQLCKSCRTCFKFYCMFMLLVIAPLVSSTSFIHLWKYIRVYQSPDVVVMQLLQPLALMIKYTIRYTAHTREIRNDHAAYNDDDDDISRRPKHHLYRVIMTLAAATCTTVPCSRWNSWPGLHLTRDPAATGRKEQQ